MLTIKQVATEQLQRVISHRLMAHRLRIEWITAGWRMSRSKAEVVFRHPILGVTHELTNAGMNYHPPLDWNYTRGCHCAVAARPSANDFGQMIPRPHRWVTATHAAQIAHKAEQGPCAPPQRGVDPTSQSGGDVGVKTRI